MLKWKVIAVALFPVMLAFQADASPPDAEILPPGVAVRQTPTAASQIVGNLPAGAQVEVLFTQNGPEGSWSQVVLPSGRTGFVPDHALRRLTSAPAWKATAPRSSAPTSTARAGEGVVEIPLRRVGGIFLVPARINNQITTNFIVDSGASIVTISHALADRLGIEYESKPKQRIVTASGFMDSPKIMLDSISVPDDAGVGAANVEAHVATLPGSPQTIGGLLGQSFLRRFQVTIDAERAVMHLRQTRQ
jgi:clan AA aspartic protease (TIGR02281 family)